MYIFYRSVRSYDMSCLVDGHYRLLIIRLVVMPRADSITGNICSAHNRCGHLGDKRVV